MILSWYVYQDGGHYSSQPRSTTQAKLVSGC